MSELLGRQKHGNEAPDSEFVIGRYAAVARSLPGRQGFFVEFVAQSTLECDGAGTVMYQMEDPAGTLNGHIAGLTVSPSGSEKWFLITPKGKFHVLTERQTAQMRSRFDGSISKRVIFNSDRAAEELLTKNADAALMRLQ